MAGTYYLLNSVLIESCHEEHRTLYCSANPSCGGSMEEEAAGLNIWVDQPIFWPIAAAEDLRRLGVQVLKSAT